MAASAAWANRPPAVFPITDLSRADDIRMRRRRAVWLLAGIMLVPAVAFSGHDERSSVRHRGGSLQQTALPTGRRDDGALSATGTSLLVTLACASSITLVPQPDLTDRVFVSTRHRKNRSDLSGLLLTGGGGELVLAGSCRSSDLVVQLPASMPISLVQSGDTDIRMGAFSGPVHLVQHGGGDLEIGSAGPLDMERDGSGDVSVGRLSGSLHMTSSGGGVLSIGQIQSDHVDIDATGSGDISIEAGHIGRLDASMHGNGDLSAQAAIDTASVQASPDSDITLPNVKTRLDRGNFAE